MKKIEIVVDGSLANLIELLTEAYQITATELLEVVPLAVLRQQINEGSGVIALNGILENIEPAGDHLVPEIMCRLESAFPEFHFEQSETGAEILAFAHNSHGIDQLLDSV